MRCIAAAGPGPLAKSSVAEVVNATLALVTSEVAKGNKVQLTGCVSRLLGAAQGCV